MLLVGCVLPNFYSTAQIRRILLWVLVLSIVPCAFTAQALSLTGVQSRMTPISGSSAFDLPIDTSQSILARVTFESRVVGTGPFLNQYFSPTIVFQFDGSISSFGTLMVTDDYQMAIAGASAIIAPSGNEVIVTFAAFATNGRRATISIYNVNGIGLNVSASLGFKVGDTNSSGTVTSADITGVKARSGQSASYGRAAYDINNTGIITAADISAVKARVQSGSPAFNVAPLANAGVAQSVVAGSIVALDGGASSDANSDPITYSWAFESKPVGSTSVLSSLTAAKPTFTADIPGTYVASLVVNDGKVDSSPAIASVDAQVNLTVPTSPQALAVTNTTSNSVSLVWNASTGGAGGVYSYQIYRIGPKISFPPGPPKWSQIGGTNAATTTFSDVNISSFQALNPSTVYSYAVGATSVGGPKSANSEIVSLSTLDFSLMKAKLTPYIVFEPATGRVVRQAFASSGVLATAAPISGYDAIAHAAIDTTLYGIRTVGVRQYSIYLYATDASVEPPIAGMNLGGNPTGGESHITIDMLSGRVIGGGGGQTSTLLLNIGDGRGGYISGERL